MKKPALLSSAKLDRSHRLAMANALRTARIALTTGDAEESAAAAILAGLEAIAFKDVDRGASAHDSWLALSDLASKLDHDKLDEMTRAAKLQTIDILGVEAQDFVPQTY